MKDDTVVALRQLDPAAAGCAAWDFASTFADHLIGTLEQARTGKVKGRPLAALRKAGADGLTDWLA